MQKYRLGLDTGTNSIGYSVISLGDKNEPKDILDMGVRIFSDGRNPKDNQPLAVARRLARGARRQRDRRLQRKKLLLNQLIRDGLFPENSSERQGLKEMDPYRLRKKALDYKLSAYELGRALFQLGTRRGFKSNRITDEPEKNKVSNSEKLSQTDKISRLEEEIVSNHCRTLGEYLNLRIERNQGIRFRNGEFDCYPSRELYQKEFWEIKRSQCLEFPDVDWNQIEKIIFFQRPLRKQERGKCQFYTDEDRAYSILPSAQRFRIASEVNNLKFSDLDGNTFTLSDIEKDSLIDLLQYCRTMSFGKIRSKLSIDLATKFNLEDERRSGMQGNEISVNMRNAECFGPAWDVLSIETQDEIIETLLESETNEEVFQYLDIFGLTPEQKQKMASMKLGKKIGKLSAHFMLDCTLLIEKEHIRYDEAVAKMHFNHSYNPIIDLRGSLPYYGQILTDTVLGANSEAPESDPEIKYGKIANPTVHIALNQLRKVVNAVIVEYGAPEQIVVELSRDIADSAELRHEHYVKQAERERTNTKITELLKQEPFNLLHPSAWDIKKYKLWEELRDKQLVSRCPYCGEVIPASKLFAEEIEIEHILPYSRTLLDSMSNLTLSHRKCNQTKKELTPYEAFGHDPDGYIWKEIKDRADNLPANKRIKFTQDAMDDFENDSNFIARQLNDNRYMSKAACKYLSCVCSQNSVWSITGHDTSFLRARWGLNTILNNEGNFKNRNDHRHHAIDALVIGLTDRSLLQKLADINKNRTGISLETPSCPFPYESVLNHVKDIVVSFKPDHGYEGRIFKETATGLKMKRTYKPLSSLMEAEVLFLENEKLKLYFTGCIEKGSSFRKVKDQLMKDFKEKLSGDDPKVIVLVPTWVTRVKLSELSKQDIEAHRVFNSKLEKLIYERTFEHLDDKKNLKGVLESLSKELNIKRVRYVPKTQLYSQIQSVPNKWYEKDGVCFMTVWAIPAHKGAKKKVFKGQFISYQEAYDFNSGKLKFFPKPHPAAKKIMTIYKNDVVKITNKDGVSYLARIAGFSTQNDSMDIQPIWAASTIGEWRISANSRVSKDLPIWKNVHADGQNFVRVNSLLGNNSLEVLRISPNGKILKHGE
ncbi:type II CRISPR RNA-guided endonuclease Cas9 [uncultured Sphaerochaeta sp.]|uniref:type II CRISPR RNA-guided endonuclease Cas9 n=1 Tax=uncultured Sphaerochaeta sp. TaxID=886478 RepID=UPI002A0A3A44|nr:type II CRISPR RNA-guided endonuclease Cas9 [uncultured Sphaerochaeta sp.]